jgi:hypothetical protein
MKRVRLFLCLATVVLVPTVFAQTTLIVKNSTTSYAEAAVYETSPTQTATQLYRLETDQTANTNLPADGNTLISVQFRQSNIDVAGTPVLIANVRLADLMNQCFSEAPVCLRLTPASQVTEGVEEANDFLAERSTTKESCLNGIVTKRSGATYFTLANGLVTRLLGPLSNGQKAGKACLCGVAGTPPEPLDTIAFEVRKPCPPRQRMKKQ